jgi:hypothetical protein
LFCFCLFSSFCFSCLLSVLSLLFLYTKPIKIVLEWLPLVQTKI